MSENNKLELIDVILNSIALKLIQDDDLCKILKYNTPDALGLEITQEDKMKLINQIGTAREIEENTRILFEPFNPSTVEDERTELRIYEYSFDLLKDSVLTTVNIAFDIIVNNKISRLNNGLRRRNIILKKVLELLNGQHVNGIGNLYFNSKFPCVIKMHNPYYTGYQLMMTTHSS